MTNTQSFNRRFTPSKLHRSRRTITAVASLFSLAATAAIGSGLSGLQPGLGASAGAAINQQQQGCSLRSDFGRMFPSLPSASFQYQDLENLSQASIERNHFEPDGKDRSDEMQKFPAGYTYAGQFIDHDIVADPRPNDLLTPVNPSQITNSRTPQLDLDSVYGNGPAGSPQMYESDGVHFRLGAPLSGASSDPQSRDLLRNASGRAIIGDDRDDENRIVGSLHSIFNRFHNRVADDVRSEHPDWSNQQVFQEAKQQVIWHYQWAVLSDFLPKMSGDKETEAVVKMGKKGWSTDLRFYNPCTASMPVEFAVAAYRFGHSVVRNDYVLNDSVRDLPVFTGSFNPTESLVGFSPAPSHFATDWNHFFELDKKTEPQNAYQMDNSLIPALRLIPGPAAGTASTILSTRNLLRGQQLGLPSGQDVARAMGIDPLPDDKILVGPTVGKDSPVTSITNVSQAFAGKAPLWTYVLAEAAANNFDVGNGRVNGAAKKNPRLGPVGGRIVNETIVGLMLADPNSILNHPEFKLNKKYASGSDKMMLHDIVRSVTR